MKGTKKLDERRVKKRRRRERNSSSWCDRLGQTEWKREKSGSALKPLEDDPKVVVRATGMHKGASPRCLEKNVTDAVCCFHFFISL